MSGRNCGRRGQEAVDSVVIQFQQPQWLTFLDLDDTLACTISGGLASNSWPTQGFLLYSSNIGLLQKGAAPSPGTLREPSSQLKPVSTMHPETDIYIFQQI